IAASSKWVVWTSTVDFYLANTSSCAIGAWNLQTMTPGPMWATDSFSCTDVALAGDSVYLPIVHLEGTNPNEDKNLKGDGIGRFDWVSGDFASASFGVFGRTTGPRRVLVDATDIYAIDPTAIVRVPRAAINAHHDFMP